MTDIERHPPPPGPVPEEQVYKSVGFSPLLMLLNIFNTCTQLMIGSVTFIALAYIFITSDSYGDAFKQHVLFCVFGYFLLMSEAILCFNTTNGWSSVLKYNQKKTAHWLLQICGSGLVIAGTVIRLMQFQARLGSTHSKLGMAGLVLTCISLIGGLVNLYSTQLRVPGSFIKIGHSLIGTGAYVCGVAAMCYGFNCSIFRNWAQDTITDTVIAFTIIGAIFVVLSPLVSVFGRVKVMVKN